MPDNLAVVAPLVVPDLSIERDVLVKLPRSIRSAIGTNLAAVERLCEPDFLVRRGTSITGLKGFAVLCLARNRSSSWLSDRTPCSCGSTGPYELTPVPAPAGDTPTPVPAPADGCKFEYLPSITKEWVYGYFLSTGGDCATGSLFHTH